MSSLENPSLGSRGIAALFCLGCALAFAPATQAAGWVDYADETATRLSTTDPAVGADDPQEKDYASGDVDKDGDADLVVVRKVPFTRDCPPCDPEESNMRDALFLNENGVLTDRTATLAPDLLDQSTNDRDVELVDVNADGWLDIVVAATFQDQPRILINLKETGGQWRGFDYQPSRLPLLESDEGIGPHFCGLGVGDVDGDGLPDLYFADYGGVVVGEGIDLNDRLLINNPSNPGFFSDQTQSRTLPSMVESCFGTDADIADMNGDGFLDVLKVTGVGSAPPGVGCPKTSVLYNDGTGHFVFEDAIYEASPYMAEPADFTQDGRLDLLVVDDNQDRYLINTGNDLDGHAQFEDHLVQQSPNTSGFGGNVKFADLDGDHVLDALVADVDSDIDDCGAEEVALLHGQGTPPDISYIDPFSGNPPWTGYSAFDVEPMHIDDDALLDLVIGACNGTRIFMSTGGIFNDGFESGDTSAWSSAVP